MKIRALVCSAILSAFPLMAASTHAQQLAITWDDLPAHGPLPAGETRVEIGRKLIAAMKDAGVPSAYGFVNGNALDREPLSAPMLKEWRNAGFPLGNHAWSHMNLNDHTLEEWETDVLKNEPILKQYAGGSDWHWLRFPYLAEGGTPEKRTEARKFLTEHDYKVATVTMSFGDYMYNEPYARCVAKGDTDGIKQLESAYLTGAQDSIESSRAMAKALFSHDIPYVLLMHVGAFDARMLPRLLKLYQKNGFSFITLEDAEKDPFYKSSVDLLLPPDPDTLDGAISAHGLKLPKPTHPAVDVNSFCR